jgi:hypothetical protein
MSMPTPSFASHLEFLTPSGTRDQMRYERYPVRHGIAGRSLPKQPHISQARHVQTSKGGHEPVATAGTAQEATRWRAVQRAAWAASLKTKVDDDFSVVLAAASLLTLSFLV